jgi:transposase
MNHIAIDLGKGESQICVRDERGKIVDETRCRTAELGAYLKKQSTSRVILETCAEAFSVADEALEQGHEVRVVKSKLASQLGIGEHGVKTDRRDARALSELSTRIDLPSVYIPSQQARELKALCNSRSTLVEVRTKLINSARGVLRPLRLGIKTGSSETFPRRVRSRLEKHPDGRPAHLERLLLAIDAMNEQILEADKELIRLTKDDEDCRRSMSMPGVGSVTALRFKAHVDEVSRFPNAHSLESFIGLTPGEDSSSDRKRITSITKAGPSALRWVLVQAAWSAWISRPKDPMVVWARKVAQRRGKQTAIVALARKMAGVLYAMWRDKADYEPTKQLRPIGVAANLLAAP